MRSFISLIIFIFIAYGFTRGQEEAQNCYSDLLDASTIPGDSTASVDYYPFPWQSVRLLPNLSIASNMILRVEDVINLDLVDEYYQVKNYFNYCCSSNHQLVGSQYALQYWEYNGAEIYSTDRYVNDIPGAISIKRLENGLYHVSIALFYKFQIPQALQLMQAIELLSFL